MRLRYPIGVCVALAMIPSVARATPRPLPFTYTTDSLAEGAMEVEQYADLTPVRAFDASSGAKVWYLASQLQTELEYGLTDRLELGLYFTYVPSAPSEYASTATLTEGNGVKQRLRYTFAEPGAWPIDVGLYGELAENEREVEFEGKILLQRRFGRLRIDANLWAEYEVYLRPNQRDVVLNPTAGMTYELSPMFHLGLESWVRRELPHPKPDPLPWALHTQVYVGPTFLLATSRIWWSTGVYARVNDTSHTMAPGEPYGAVWIRTIVGFDL